MPKCSNDKKLNLGFSSPLSCCVIILFRRKEKSKIIKRFRHFRSSDALRSNTFLVKKLHSCEGELALSTFYSDFRRKSEFKNGTILDCLLCKTIALWTWKKLVKQMFKDILRRKEVGSQWALHWPHTSRAAMNSRRIIVKYIFDCAR